MLTVSESALYRTEFTNRDISTEGGYPKQTFLTEFVLLSSNEIANPVILHTLDSFCWWWSLFPTLQVQANTPVTQI